MKKLGLVYQAVTLKPEPYKMVYAVG